MSQNMKKELIEWIKVIVIAGILAVAITHFIKPTIVKGVSMYPTLQPNDYLIMNRVAYKNKPIEYLDVIVFESDILLNESDPESKKDLVKRVIGLPGDHILIKDGDVYRNDEKLEEPYIKDGVTDRDIEADVPEGHVFVMGDNRLNSSDSRDEDVGMVDEKVIIGKVIIRLFPFNKITTNFLN
ncbi:MAG: signal peptidase I, partial [Filifactor alocis]|nr:signal peptidase I [Filifactor alocis]